MLKTEVQELEASKVALTVEVGVEKVTAAYNNFYKNAAKQIRVPGFRKGKVPKGVISNYMGQEAVNEQVEKDLLQEVYPEIIEDSKIEPVSPPTIEESEIAEGKPYKCKAIVEVRPKLGEFNYKDLSVSVKREEIDEDSLKKLLQQIRVQRSTPTQIEEGGLENGDFFTADFKVYENGELQEDLSHPQFSGEFDEKDEISGFMKGMTKGENRKHSADFTDKTDDGSGDPYLGKKLEFDATMNSITRKILPELNDEFAKSLGEYENLDALKAALMKDLEERSKEDAEERAFDAMVEQIINNYEFELPEGMVQSTTDYFIESLEQRYGRLGISLRDYVKNSGMTVKEFRETFRDKAVLHTKTMLILEAIGEREKIEVTDSEYREEIEERAKTYGMSPDQFIKLVTQHAEEDGIRYSIRAKKIKDFLLTNNLVQYDMVKEADLVAKEETAS
ncbi:MAG: trigger factor [Candidatus Riflebacteria bacterium]|nr:trigger factor [Candidatus Riflebacteria bacterium]